MITITVSKARPIGPLVPRPWTGTARVQLSPAAVAETRIDGESRIDVWTRCMAFVERQLAIASPHAGEVPS